MWTPSSRSSTGIRSFAEWMSSVASSVSIVFSGKYPYATVPNASPQEVAVRESWARHRRQCAPGSISLDERVERVPQGRVDLRACAADRLVELELVGSRRRAPLESAARRPPVSAREEAGSRRHLAQRRDHVPLVRRVDHRRRQREREERLDELARASGRARSHAPRRPRAEEPPRASPRAAPRLRDELSRRLVGAERLAGSAPP